MKKASSSRIIESTGDGDKKEPDAEEFLSGFGKGDKLIPSITLTILFSPKPWDGPRSLFEMMGVSDPAVQACMDDYRIHLIAPAQMSDGEIMKFQSSLREVLFFIKYSEDKDELSQILENNKKRFGELERRAVDVIKAVTNTGMKYKNSLSDSPTLLFCSFQTQFYKNSPTFFKKHLTNHAAIHDS